MRLVTIRTGDGTRAGRIEGEEVVELDYLDVGALLADDVSAAAVIVGPEIDPAAVDLPAVRVAARVGEATFTGDAGAVLGDPARAVAWLCADLHRRGEGLAAGDLVLSGALVGPTPVAPGEVVRADLGELASLETVFVRPGDR